MTERDEEGRPVATRNAGAFLGPFSGVVPVPSSAGESEGRVEPALTPRMRWLIAGGDAIAVWTVCFCALQVALSGTTDWAGSTGGTLGIQMAALLHTPGFLLVAHALLFALASWIGIRRLQTDENSVRLRMVAVTLAGAAVVSIIVVLIGALAAVAGIVVALVWLGFANRV